MFFCRSITLVPWCLTVCSWCIFSHVSPLPLIHPTSLLPLVWRQKVTSASEQKHIFCLKQDTQVRKSVFIFKLRIFDVFQHRHRYLNMLENCVSNPDQMIQSKMEELCRVLFSIFTHNSFTVYISWRLSMNLSTPGIQTIFAIIYFHSHLSNSIKRRSIRTHLLQSILTGV